MVVPRRAPPEATVQDRFCAKVRFRLGTIAHRHEPTDPVAALAVGCGVIPRRRVAVSRGPDRRRRRGHRRGLHRPVHRAAPRAAGRLGGGRRGGRAGVGRVGPQQRAGDPQPVAARSGRHRRATRRGRRTVRAAAERQRVDAVRSRARRGDRGGSRTDRLDPAGAHAGPDADRRAPGAAPADTSPRWRSRAAWRRRRSAPARASTRARR